MKYFKKIASLEDLKRQYKTLLKENHPDNGGDVDAMKEINVQFDALFSIWKNCKQAETGENVTETADHVRSEFYTDFGWEGKNHSWKRTLTDVAQIVRTYVKEKYPTYKFSVRASKFRQLFMSLKSSPVYIYKTNLTELTPDEKDLLRMKLQRHDLFPKKNWNEWELDKAILDAWKNQIDWYKVYDKKTADMLNDINEFVKSYNYEKNSRVGFFYFGCEPASDFKVVPKTIRTRKVLTA